jgi:hypothetical protein
MITSEAAFVIVRLVVQMVSILGVSHILSAIWYIIGKAASASHGRSWILHAELSAAEPFYIYLTAMHWTLTQFTPASMDVQAQSVPERLFNICLILLGLCVFSAFVSSITTSMTQLANISSAQSKQLWVLRKYLKQHNINGSLQFRILRHLERAYKRDALSPTNVLALQRLSDQLRSELLVTVSMACLRAHPLFENLSHLLDSVAILSSSLRDFHLEAEDLLFSDATPAPSMDFPQTGAIAYSRFAVSSFMGRDGYLEVETIANGGWLSEAALWTDWVHIGTAQAREDSNLVSVLAQEFRTSIKRDSNLLKLSSHYANEFVKMLQYRCYRGVSDTLKGTMQMTMSSLRRSELA